LRSDELGAAVCGAPFKCQRIRPGRKSSLAGDRIATAFYSPKIGSGGDDDDSAFAARKRPGRCLSEGRVDGPFVHASRAETNYSRPRSRPRVALNSWRKDSGKPMRHSSPRPANAITTLSSNKRTKGGNAAVANQ